MARFTDDNTHPCNCGEYTGENCQCDSVGDTIMANHVRAQRKQHIVSPAFKTGRPIVRGKDIPIIMYDLFHIGTPHGKEGRVDNIITNYAKKCGYTADKDAKGNLWVYVKCDPKDAKTMFSCHMDTVHSEEQKLKLMITQGGAGEEAEMVFAVDSEDHKNGAVLGADDKVGIFILLKLMQAGIKGLYMFHVGEEAGCVGSRWISTNDELKEKIKGIERAIAFDRRDYTDVIHTQTGGRCASVEFTEALAAAINNGIKEISGVIPPKDYAYSPCPGICTDTNSYRNIIPECTNLSVGYFNQHCEKEYFDFFWLTKWFIPSVLAIKWDELPTKRDPTPVVYVVPNRNHYTGGHDYRNHAYDSDWNSDDHSYETTPAWMPTDGYPWDNPTPLKFKERIAKYLRLMTQDMAAWAFEGWISKVHKKLQSKQLTELRFERLKDEIAILEKAGKIAYADKETEEKVYDLLLEIDEAINNPMQYQHVVLQRNIILPEGTNLVKPTAVVKESEGHVQLPFGLFINGCSYRQKLKQVATIKGVTTWSFEYSSKAPTAPYITVTITSDHAHAMVGQTAMEAKIVSKSGAKIDFRHLPKMAPKTELFISFGTNRSVALCTADFFSSNIKKPTLVAKA